MSANSNGSQDGAAQWSNKVTLMLVEAASLPADFETLQGDQKFNCKKEDRGDHFEVSFTVAPDYVREVRKNFCGFPNLPVGASVRVSGDNERLLNSLKNYYRHHGVTVLE